MAKQRPMAGTAGSRCTITSEGETLSEIPALYCLLMLTQEDKEGKGNNSPAVTSLVRHEDSVRV